LGENAGSNLSGSDSNNIDIGADVEGVSGESNTIRIGNPDITTTIIRGISGQTIPSGAAMLVAANGQLGTVTSSRRFKEDIKPMDKASEALFSLKPVSFRYKKEIDPAGREQFGLVAEDVEKVNPDLVVRDESGNLSTVRYDEVNTMLLNEFLKEHKALLEAQRKVEEQGCKIEEQEATSSQLQREIETVAVRLNDQDAKIQKVRNQIEISRTATQMVLNH